MADKGLHSRSKSNQNNNGGQSSGIDPNSIPDSTINPQEHAAAAQSRSGAAAHTRPGSTHPSTSQPTQDTSEPAETSEETNPEAAAEPSAQPAPTPGATTQPSPTKPARMTPKEFADKNPQPQYQGPGRLAPRSGQPDPDKMGGAPFDKYAGESGLKGIAAGEGSRFARFMRHNPKGKLWALIALIGALVSFIIFMISIPFTLIHMAKTLLEHNFGDGNRIERRVGSRTLSRLFQEKNARAATGAEQHTGHPILDKMANMKMDRFNKMLAKDNLKLEFEAKTGRLTGIKNIRTGVIETDFSSTNFLDRRSAITNLVNERIAPWRVLKRLSYIKVMKYHARVSFRFWPKEKIKDINKLLLTKIRQGASLSELRTTSSGTSAQQAADKTATTQNGTGDAADAIKATNESMLADGNQAVAIEKGTSVLRTASLRFFGFTGIFALVCTVQQLATEAANAGYMLRLVELMRMGNLLPTMMSQMYTGKDLDMASFGAVMSKFTGDPRAPDDSVNHKGWDQSAAYKRIVGEPVVTDAKSQYFNPDMSQAANPDGFFLKNIMDVVNQIMAAVPGYNLLCQVATSWFGFLLQVGEAVIGLWGAETNIVAAAIVKTAIQFALFQAVVPVVLQAATSLAVTGTENAVGMFNNADGGSQISAEEYHRSYGGRQITNGEKVALIEANRQDDIKIAQEKGWFYRNLDITNTHSVASNMLIKVPNSPQKALAALTNIPKTFATSFGAIMFGNLQPSYAAVTTANPYGFQYYGFPQAEVDLYPDPVANEQYLAQPIAGTTKTRLSVLGDSSTYSPIDGDDTNMDDLMHCFVNTPVPPGTNGFDSQDPICIGIGVLTSRNNDTVNNPTDDIVKQIYAKAGIGGISYDNDFMRYRMELFYIHQIRGLECASTDLDCFTGKATP